MDLLFVLEESTPVTNTPETDPMLPAEENIPVTNIHVMDLLFVLEESIPVTNTPETDPMLLLDGKAVNEIR